MFFSYWNLEILGLRVLKYKSNKLKYLICTTLATQVYNSLVSLSRKIELIWKLNSELIPRKLKANFYIFTFFFDSDEKI